MFLGLVVSSERCEEPDAPSDLTINMKTYLGQLAIAEIEDQRAVLPSSQAIIDDFRLIRRHKGGFNNIVDSASGRHGDIFDSYKLAIYALRTDSGIVEATAVRIGREPSAAPPRPSSRLTMHPEDYPPEDQPSYIG